MNYILNCHWNKKVIKHYLEEAADIHRRLPPVKVRGYFNLWPETLKDDWERLYDAVHGNNHLGSPTPREVSYHEEIMGWLRWITPYEQQLIWMRANRIPWKIIVEEFGRSKVTLWRKMDRGLTHIESTLIVRSMQQ